MSIILMFFAGTLYGMFLSWGVWQGRIKPRRVTLERIFDAASLAWDRGRVINEPLSTFMAATRGLHQDKETAAAFEAALYQVLKEDAEHAR